MIIIINNMNDKGSFSVTQWTNQKTLFYFVQNRKWVMTVIVREWIELFDSIFKQFGGSKNVEKILL